MYELSEQVQKLESKYEEAAGLLGTIMATLSLPANRDYLEKNAADLLDVIDQWKRQYDKLTP